ncbi:MAG: hypothetical protein CMD25_04160 [Flavobacteriales bacterium]|nr:hypothetical protein [Flavobacteriales bacterium]
MSNIKKILPSLVDSGNFTSDLVPDGSGTRDLGSSAKPWKDLYVTSGTINIGGETISVDDDGISFSRPIKVREGGQTRRLRATNSDFITTGDTGNFADVSSLESFPRGLNVGTSTNLASRTLQVVGDVEISGTIFQSGSVFEGGGGGGGGGGSSTFTGLSDTPSSFTANKYLSVNSAGNAIEMVDAVQSGHQSVEQGYFTGLTLNGTGTGILQNASGTISNLDLADNKFDVSVIEERDSTTGDAYLSSVELQCTYETNINDESDNAVTATAVGSAARSTSQAKEGSASLDTNGDYITFPYSADYTKMSGDFTIEVWFYYQGDEGMIASAGNGSNGWGFYVNTSGDGGNHGIRWQTYGSQSMNVYQRLGGSFSSSTWYHAAVVRSGNSVKVYLNGVSSHGASSMTSGLENGSNTLLYVGTYSGTGQQNLQRLDAFLDLFRITTAARYTSNFTPPTSFQGNVTEAKYIGQIGGIDDSDVDYGIQKLSNSQLMIKKLSSNDFTPDRLYVNVNKLGALGQGIAFDQLYTGDGTTTNYALSENVSNARDVLVSVEGLIQTPITDYTLLGQTGVSFTTGVTSGHEISFRHLALGPSGATGPAGASANISYLTNRFTGNGVVSGFEMTRSISTADQIFVFVNGLVQDSGENFSVTNGTGLFFSSGEIASGDKIMVRHIY